MSGQIFKVGDRVQLMGTTDILGYDPYHNQFLLNYPGSETSFYLPADIEPFRMEPVLEYQLPSFASKWDDELELRYDLKKDRVYYIYEPDKLFEINGVFYAKPVLGTADIITFQAKSVPAIHQDGDKYAGFEIDGQIIRGEITSTYIKALEVEDRTDTAAQEVAAVYSGNYNSYLRINLNDEAYIFVRARFFTKI
jgi:hypothetical protein